MKCKKCHREIEDLKICPYCKSKQVAKKVIKNTKSTIDSTEKELEKVSFLNNSSIITYILIGLLLFNLVFSCYNNTSSFIGFILSNIVNIVLLIYFVTIQSKFGKTNFKYFNYLVLLFLFIMFIKVFLNIFVSFNISNLFNIISLFLLVIFFVKSFIKNDYDILDSIENKGYFYYIVGSSFISFLFKQISLISYIDPLTIILSIVDLLIIVFFSRYIYLYLEHKDTLFLEIDKIQKEIDENKISSTINELFSKYNKYQIISFIILIIGLALGIVIGSEYRECVNNIYNSCMAEQFNIKLLLITYGITFLISLIVYWMGEVIYYLRKISEKDKKKVKKSVKVID